jgi:hypothetical protein
VRRSYSDIAVAEAIAILGCVADFIHLPKPVMTMLGLALFAAPGYFWSEVFLSPRTLGLERVAVAAGLVLIVPVLGGVGLYAAGVPLNRTAWVGLLAMVTLVGAGVTLIIRRRRRSDMPPRRPVRRRRWSAGHAVAFGAAALIAAGAVGLAVFSAGTQKYAGYTQLWLSPLPARASTASLGVDNEQGAPVQYRLVMRRRGRVTATWNLTLASGQTWQRTIPYTTGYAIAANLYRLPDLKSPYRQVDNGVSPPRKPAAPRRTHPSGRHS